MTPTLKTRHTLRTLDSLIPEVQEEEKSGVSYGLVRAPVVVDSCDECGKSMKSRIHPRALHLCSEACNHAYLDRVFGRR